MLNAAYDEAALKRIAAANTYQQRLRLEAHLGVLKDLGYCKVRPLTLKDAITLEYTENVLINATEVLTLENWQDYENDILLLGWQLKPLGDGRNERKFAHDATRELRRKHKQCIPLVQEYLRAVFIDIPSGKSEGTRQITHWANVLIDQMASAYKWTLNDIYETPIAVVLQLLQQVNARLGGDEYVIQNRIVNAQKAKELKLLNLRNQLSKEGKSNG